jgi:hypothetical protein
MDAAFRRFASMNPRTDTGTSKESTKAHGAAAGAGSPDHPTASGGANGNTHGGEGARADARRRRSATADVPGAPRSRHLLPAPEGEAARLTLHALRRMVSDGITDAWAAQAMIATFGAGFRRPLVLLRAVVLELSHDTARKITLAPACCRRMTRDEARILAVLRHAPADEPRARRHLARLTGTAQAPRALCTAAAYGWALRDLGAPL